MNPLIHRFLSYLQENPLQYEDADIHNLCEYLWQCRTDLCPIDNEKIRAGFDALDACFAPLGFDARNAVFSLASDLCQEHERLAFAEGIRLGAQLILELVDFTDDPQT